MHNITRLHSHQILTLAERLTYADANGLSVRISTGVNYLGHYIMWDIGNTGWTPPLYGDHSGADCSNPDCDYTEHGVTASNRRQSEFYAENPRG